VAIRTPSGDVMKTRQSFKVSRLAEHEISFRFADCLVIFKYKTKALYSLEDIQVILWLTSQFYRIL